MSKIRPRLTQEEYDLFKKIKDNDFVIEQLNLLEQECEKAGIPLENVKHYWYKSKKFSLFAKNKVMSYEQVKDDIIKEMDSYSPNYPTISRKPYDDPHLLVIDPSDIHIGKLAVASETGNDYDIKKAIERTKSGVRSLLRKSQGFCFDKIVFVIGNDALHIDNPKRTTTSGTPQDTDGMWHQAFHAAKKMYIELIETLVPVADVHVMYCPSNHDFTHGFFLADTLKSWFRKSKNITFDSDIIHRKYFKYGLNMIEADHGDGCKVKDTPMLMATEEPRMWADTKYRYSYKHHKHHKIKVGAIVEMGFDGIGVNIEFLRSPSPADSWHHRNGYVNMPAVEAFVHSPEEGRIASFTHYF